MASSPKIPDPNAASVAGALAQAGTFPFQQYIDYLAQTGPYRQIWLDFKEIMARFFA